MKKTHLNPKALYSVSEGSSLQLLQYHDIHNIHDFHDDLQLVGNGSPTCSNCPASILMADPVACRIRAIASPFFPIKPPFLSCKHRKFPMYFPVFDRKCWIPPECMVYELYGERIGKDDKPINHDKPFGFGAPSCPDKPLQTHLFPRCRCLPGPWGCKHVLTVGKLRYTRPTS